MAKDYKLLFRLSEKENKKLNPGERVASGTKQLARFLGIKLNQSQIQEIKKLAKNIVNKFGKADLITATNVFAHMADLGKVIRSIKKFTWPNF